MTPNPHSKIYRGYIAILCIFCVFVPISIFADTIAQDPTDDERSTGGTGWGSGGGDSKNQQKDQAAQSNTTPPATPTTGSSQTTENTGSQGTGIKITTIPKQITSMHTTYGVKSGSLTDMILGGQPVKAPELCHTIILNREKNYTSINPNSKKVDYENCLNIVLGKEGQSENLTKQCQSGGGTMYFPPQAEKPACCIKANTIKETEEEVKKKKDTNGQELVVGNCLAVKTLDPCVVYTNEFFRLRNEYTSAYCGMTNAMIQSPTMREGDILSKTGLTMIEKINNDFLSPSTERTLNGIERSIKGRADLGTCPALLPQVNEFIDKTSTNIKQIRETIPNSKKESQTLYAAGCAKITQLKIDRKMCEATPNDGPSYVDGFLTTYNQVIAGLGPTFLDSFGNLTRKASILDIDLMGTYKTDYNTSINATEEASKQTAVPVFSVDTFIERMTKQIETYPATKKTVDTEGLMMVQEYCTANIMLNVDGAAGSQAQGGDCGTRMDILAPNPTIKENLEYLALVYKEVLAEINKKLPLQTNTEILKVIPKGGLTSCDASLIQELKLDETKPGDKALIETLKPEIERCIDIEKLIKSLTDKQKKAEEENAQAQAAIDAQKKEQAQAAAAKTAAPVKSDPAKTDPTTVAKTDTKETTTTEPAKTDTATAPKTPPKIKTDEEIMAQAREEIITECSEAGQCTSFSALGMCCTEGQRPANNGLCYSSSLVTPDGRFCPAGITTDSTYQCIANNFGQMGIHCSPQQLLIGACSLRAYETMQIRASNRDPSPKTFIQDLLLSATSFIGVVVTISLMVSGRQLITAGGIDEGAAASAKKNIGYAVVGMILVAFSYTIIRLVQYVSIGNY